MKLLSSIHEIAVLSKDNVHIKNKEQLLSKLNKLIKDGNKNLQIVTDFDHTLTRHKTDNGTMVLTSFGMFSQCPSIPQHYKDENKRLSDYYRPIEMDPNMNIKEKTKHAIDWYIAANELLKGIKFPRDEVMQEGKNMLNNFRIGVNEMIAWSQQHQVPVLVFSAGLGECVVAALQAANYLLPHVKVVSNFLAMDENDTIVGIKGEIIHTCNKNESAIRNSEYYEMVRGRSNVLLMGDNIGDAGMAEGMDHCDAVIKIGFLGHKVDGNLKNYLEVFDIVTIEDPTMDIPNAILNSVL